MSALEDLLVVQEHDSAADRLRHKLDTLPEKTRLAEVDQTLAAIDTSMDDVGRRRDDVVRRQQRHEDELASVEAKIGEVDKRLYSGTVTVPRELQAMQADVASLKRHRSEIEDQVLEAMQDREPLDGEVATLEQQRSSLEQEADELRQAIVDQTKEIEAELATELEARSAAAAGIPTDLLSQYERLRTQQGGIGAARLVGNRCSGCHLTLPATELDRLRHETPDVVVLCDQCGRILVR
jgi:predicted  nucleic acid-binding Zn-ribbon protein